MGLFPPQYFRKTEGIHRRGLAAARPNAADVLIGTLYFSSDTGVLERSNGVTWDSYSGSGTVVSSSSPIVLTDRDVDDIQGTPLLPSTLAYLDRPALFQSTVDIIGDLHVNPGNMYSNLMSCSTSKVGTLLDLQCGQIQFPAVQNPSAGANTLDDYEEGTWTPALNLNASTVGITYSTQSGGYTKVGNLVEADFTFTLTSKGASVGVATITGLPFSAAAVTTGPVDFATGIAGGITVIPFEAIAGSTLFLLYYDNVGGRNQITNTQITNTTTLQGSIVYRV